MTVALFPDPVEPRALMADVADVFDPPAHPYADNPVGYVHEELGEETWSKQREVLESTWRNRYTLVPSAHETGKSHIASRAAVTWIETKEDPFVVTTAPTQTQVEAILWRYIGQCHDRHGLKGRITGGGNPMWKIGNEIIAYGRKPTDYADPEKAMAAFQGIHAKNVLVILDEAAGIPDWLWDAVDTLVGNDNARVLAIGNPAATTRFEKNSRPGQGWNTIHISAFDTPAFTGEKVSNDLKSKLVGKRWVKERVTRWGKKSALYISKVLGLFPEVDDSVLISPATIRLCQETVIVPDPATKGTLGVDVAREGGDETAIYRNRDGHIRKFKIWGHNTVPQISGFLIKTMRRLRKLVAVVDVIGVGGGVYDNVREENLPVGEFRANDAARKPKRFRDRKAEVWWTFKEMCEDGEIDLPPDGEDDDLISQLQSVRWFLDGKGRIYIESKKDLAKRGLPSPDRADAVVMSTIPETLMSIPEPDPEKDVDGITDDLLGLNF